MSGLTLPVAVASRLRRKPTANRADCRVFYCTCELPICTYLPTDQVAGVYHAGVADAAHRRAQTKDRRRMGDRGPFFAL